MNYNIARSRSVSQALDISKAERRTCGRDGRENWHAKARGMKAKEGGRRKRGGVGRGWRKGSGGCFVRECATREGDEPGMGETDGREGLERDSVRVLENLS